MLTLARWDGHLLNGMMTAAGLLLLAMTVMIGADVLFRNIGAGGIPPSNELSEDSLYLVTLLAAPGLLRQDRKSTRLNSSHQIISYAVFCLKKKKSYM